MTASSPPSPPAAALCTLRQLPGNLPFDCLCQRGLAGPLPWNRSPVRECVLYDAAIIAHASPTHRISDKAFSPVCQQFLTPPTLCSLCSASHVRLHIPSTTCLESPALLFAHLPPQISCQNSSFHTSLTTSFPSRVDSRMAAFPDDRSVPTAAPNRPASAIEL